MNPWEQLACVLLGLVAVAAFCVAGQQCLALRDPAERERRAVAAYLRRLEREMDEEREPW